MIRRITLVSTALFTLVLGWEGVAPAESSPGPLGGGVSLSADFDGDGFDDLAVGVSSEDLGSRRSAGAVNVIYGSGGGLFSTGDQFWTQDSSGIDDTAEATDEFGAAVAAGDFDGDGFDDLAIGAPGQDGSFVAEGAVTVIYGSSGGLVSGGNQFWSQRSPGIQGTAENADRFGSALTAADFDGDGFDDLAVGVEGEDVGSILSAGSVNVLYGSGSFSIGLTSTGNQLWHQDSSGIQGTAEQSDVFGRALTAGDFDGDGFDDLSVGVEGEDVGTTGAAGSVNVLYGASSIGLTSTANQLWHQDTSGVEDVVEQGDEFGGALTAGDFDGDGFADLAVGAESEDVASATSAGAVNVLHGSSSIGLSSAGDQLWTQATPGTLDVAEPFDHFGAALAGGDLDDDGFSDLAVGVPDEAVGTLERAGAVSVVYGSSDGLSPERDQFWTQDSTGIENPAEESDQFGDALVVLDFNGGPDDLAVGMFREDVGTIIDGGAANVIYGSGTGLSSGGDQFWTQDSSGINDLVEGSDWFGRSLAGG